MPKIEAGATTPTQSFDIDGVPFQRGAYEIVVDGDKIGINRIGAQRIGTAVLEDPVIFSDWTDNTDTPLGSVAAWITYVEPFFFLA